MSRTDKSTSTGERFVLVEAGTNRLYFRLRPDGIEPLAAAPTTAATILFSAHESRVVIDGAVSREKAKRLAMREAGEVVRIVYARERKTVYCLPAEYLAELDHPVASGLLTLDRLLERGVRAKAMVCGFVLHNKDNDRQLLVLYALNDGRLSAPQVSINVDDAEFILGQFAQQHGVAVDDKSVTLFSADDLYNVAARSALYPQENDFAGIPISSARRLAATAVVSAFLLGSASAAYYGWMKHASEQRTRSLLAQTDTAKTRLAERARADVQGFARLISLDSATLFTRAEGLIAPGAKVELEAAYTGTTLTVKIPFRSASFANFNSPYAITSLDNLSQTLHIKAPPGCEPGQHLMSGDMNYASIKFHCPTDHGAIARLRGS